MKPEYLVYYTTAEGKKLYRAGPYNSLYTTKQKNAHRYTEKPALEDLWAGEKVVRLR